eukprot:TRINITY_DN14605_c0_g1_i1.p2 TRINITY_DN14605_c0_g1~~TRINITY_DN14605_c0_g1_i1.p2  ORF type:complete len:153 (-),score=50.50 TRINITY_DN14605_c0_g1_i1:82-540(-)
MLVRTVLVTLVCSVAYAVPDFSIFSNFVGSLLLPFVGFILPPFLFFRVVLLPGWWKTRVVDVNKRDVLRRWCWACAMVFSILFGCVFIIIGLFTTLINTIQKKKKKKKKKKKPRKKKTIKKKKQREGKSDRQGGHSKNEKKKKKQHPKQWSV